LFALSLIKLAEEIYGDIARSASENKKIDAGEEISLHSLENYFYRLLCRNACFYSEGVITIDRIIKDSNKIRNGTSSSCNESILKCI
jgi:hypothetical protein